MAKSAESAVLVIGLGRFGTALAEELMASGHDVMAIERDRNIVQHYADDFTSVVQADATDQHALNQLGVDSFDTVVVGIGTSIESSVLTVANLVDLGIPNIWAKALTRAHGQILDRIGANHVIYPEQEAGERTAHLLGGTMRNFTEFSPGHALANITIPKTLAGRPMRDLRLKDRYGVIVVAYEDANNFHHVDSETQLPEGGNMLVAGPTHRVDEFARRL